MSTASTSTSSLFSLVAIVFAASYATSAQACWWDAHVRAHYLAMSDAQLLFEALHPNTLFGIGSHRCYIERGGAGSACDVYVKTATIGSHSHRGWPRTTGGLGTGCVKSPDFAPKRVSHCYYNDPQYALTNAERASFCTNSGLTNAVNQLRHAINDGQCSFC